MLEGKVVKEGLEDGELGLEGFDVLVAERGAVSGILAGERGSILEGGKADSAARRHLQPR